MHTTAYEVLDFWFGAPDDPGHTLPRAAWFQKDAAFDAEIARRFGPLIDCRSASEIESAGSPHEPALGDTDRIPVKRALCASRPVLLKAGPQPRR